MASQQSSDRSAKATPAGHQQRVTDSGPALTLASQVQYLKGVGPERARLLARLGLRTVGDLLFFFPRDYETMVSAQSVSELVEGAPARWIGTVEEVEIYNTGPGRSVLGVLVRRQRDYVRAVWFNQPYPTDRVQRGELVALEGKPRFKGLRWEFVHPRIRALDAVDHGDTEEWLPVYRLTEGLKQHQLRQWIQRALDACLELVPEALPDALRQKHDLPTIGAALRGLHRPTDAEHQARCRHRFVFQELLVLQLALAWQRRERLTLPAEPLPADTRIDARIRRLFGFPLTADQDRAIKEVARDMGQPVPMNRLLQGDVGTGKTVVAIYAMLLAVAHGAQAALMAPTELLAGQHLRTLQRMLAHARVRMGLLAGQMPASQRKSLLADLRAGQIDIVVGTQAIIQNDVQFARLGLTVVDEQHKFGVRQRAQLRTTGKQPHALVMTATPIPRSIALAEFGDLEVSSLRESPPGRQPVHTYITDHDLRDRWWDFFRRKLNEGRQGYVIVPVLDQQEAGGVTSLEEAYESLVNGELEAYRLGLVHGRMSGEEKDVELEKFRRGETQVLVATSVVEVGIDVPNATVMTIESGERFGLAQLHQLRGRVSRGQHPGYVSVFAEARTEESQARLQAFAASSDGFELAERDYQLRGPGELLGTRQHGGATLRVADLQRDRDILQCAQEVARQLVETEEFQAGSAYARLRELMERHHGETRTLGDIG